MHSYQVASSTWKPKRAQAHILQLLNTRGRLIRITNENRRLIPEEQHGQCPAPRDLGLLCVCRVYVVSEWLCIVYVCVSCASLRWENFQGSAFGDTRPCLNTGSSHRTHTSSFLHSPSQCPSTELEGKYRNYKTTILFAPRQFWGTGLWQARVPAIEVDSKTVLGK